MNRSWARVLSLMAVGFLSGGASASGLSGSGRLASEPFGLGAFEETIPAHPIDTRQFTVPEAAQQETISRPAAGERRYDPPNTFADRNPQAAKELLKDTIAPQPGNLTTLPNKPPLESGSPVRFNSGAPLRNKDGEIMSGDLAPVCQPSEPVAPLVKVEIPEDNSGEVTFPALNAFSEFQDANQSEGRLTSAAESSSRKTVFLPSTNTASAITFQHVRNRPSAGDGVGNEDRSFHQVGTDNDSSGSSRSSAVLPGEVLDGSKYKPVAPQVRSLGPQDQEAVVSAGMGVPSGWDRGMSFVGFDRSAFAAGAGNGSVDAAKNQLGIKTAVFVPHLYTRTGGSSKIFRNWKTPTDSGLKAIARHARNQLGMKVVIKPHIDSLDETWRGLMQFSNRNAFWNDYTRIILHYAALADDVNAQGLVIGTELSRVQNDQPHKWRKLIGRVRNRFDGMVYYAANWDTVLSVENLPRWFSLLDVIGIDYYLDNTNCAPQKMWQTIVDIRKRFGDGVVISESGGDSGGNQKSEYKAANHAMRAGRNKSWFKGIWWYDCYTFTRGGYGKTWDDFTPNKSTSKWLCRKQTKKSNGQCNRMIDQAWK